VKPISFLMVTVTFSFNRHLFNSTHEYHQRDIFDCQQHGEMVVNTVAFSPRVGSKLPVPHVIRKCAKLIMGRHVHVPFPENGSSTLY
jgi:hypothetical protein